MALFGLILAQAAAQQNGGPPAWNMFVPMIGIGLVAWFLLIVPMRRQEKQRKELMAAVKKSDRIVNSGGIIGIVESVKDQEDEVVLRGGLRITKSSIVKVVPADGSAKD